MTCDECQKPLTPNRTRRVMGVTEHDRSREHHFCTGCHGEVFRLADWRRYPALFEERRDWDDRLADWQLADEIAPVLEISARGFGNMFTARDGRVFGLDFERVWNARENRWLYRGIKP